MMIERKRRHFRMIAEDVPGEMLEGGVIDVGDHLEQATQRRQRVADRIEVALQAEGDILAAPLQFIAQLLLFPVRRPDEGHDDQRQRDQDRHGQRKDAAPPDIGPALQQQQAERRGDEHTEGIAEPPVPPGKRVVGCRHDPEGEQRRDADGG